MSVVKHNISDDILTLDIFLSHDECLKLIERADLIGFEEAKVGFPDGAAIHKNIRNNTRIMIKDITLATELFERAYTFLPVAMDGNVISRFNEMARFYKYETGQRFKRHKDGSYKTDTEESYLSFLIYLNEGCDGGETVIRENLIADTGESYFVEHVITPKTGTALIFPHPLWHEGRPIQSGEKYVLRFDVMYKKRSTTQ